MTRVLSIQDEQGHQKASDGGNKDVTKAVIHLNAHASAGGLLWDVPHQPDVLKGDESVSLEYDALKLQKKVLDSLGFVDCDVERAFSAQEMMPLGQVPHANHRPHHLEQQTDAVNNGGFSYQITHMEQQYMEYSDWHSQRNSTYSRTMTQDDWPSLAHRFPSQDHATEGNVEVCEEECLVGLKGLYQSYCNQIITPTLNQATILALTKLKNLQIAMDAGSGQGKGSMNKKYYCSLKEVSKVAKSCKLLVIAPDVKPSPTAHIKPVRMLLSVIEDAAHAGVPYIFALSRKGIGQIFGKDKHMSIMALMSLDQIEEECAIMIKEATYGRTMYQSYHRAKFSSPVQ